MLTETAAAAALDVEYLCDASIDFEPVQTFATPLGARLVFVIRRGSVTGPWLRGEFLPGGGDWTVVGTDGVVRFDVRATIRTDDGELVYLTVTGRAALPDGGVERLYAGETIGWDEMYARTAPLFETGAERYAWLNSTVTVGINEFSLGHIDYRVYGLC